jgi:hypothetical protein
MICHQSDITKHVDGHLMIKIDMLVVGGDENEKIFFSFSHFHLHISSSA